MPAAGSMICGAAILIPLSLVVDRPWTLAPSANSIAGAARPVDLLDGPRLRDLLPADPHAGLGRHHSAGLFAGADRRGIGVVFLGETLASTAWIGLAFVIVGVAAMTFPARRRAVAARFDPVHGDGRRGTKARGVAIGHHAAKLLPPGCPNRFPGVCCRRLHDEPDKTPRRWRLRGRFSQDKLEQRRRNRLRALVPRRRAKALGCSSGRVRRRCWRSPWCLPRSPNGTPRWPTPGRPCLVSS